MIGHRIPCINRFSNNNDLVSRYRINGQTEKKIPDPFQSIFVRAKKLED